MIRWSFFMARALQAHFMFCAGFDSLPAALTCSSLFCALSATSLFDALPHRRLGIGSELQSF